MKLKDFKEVPTTAQGEPNWYRLSGDVWVACSPEMCSLLDNLGEEEEND